MYVYMYNVCGENQLYYVMHGVNDVMWGDHCVELGRSNWGTLGTGTLGTEGCPEQ